MELCQFGVDGLAEFSDLLLIAHINGNGNRSTTPPMSIGSLPSVVVQVICWALVSAAYINEVAEVDGSACRGRDSAIPMALGLSNCPEGVRVISRCPVSNTPPGAMILRA